jgi:hypothetical protein
LSVGIQRLPVTLIGAAEFEPTVYAVGGARGAAKGNRSSSHVVCAKRNHSCPTVGWMSYVAPAISTSLSSRRVDVLLVTFTRKRRAGVHWNLGVRVESGVRETGLFGDSQTARWDRRPVGAIERRIASFRLLYEGISKPNTPMSTRGGPKGERAAV